MLQHFLHRHCFIVRHNGDHHGLLFYHHRQDLYGLNCGHLWGDCLHKDRGQDIHCLTMERVLSYIRLYYHPLGKVVMEKALWTIRNMIWTTLLEDPTSSEQKSFLSSTRLLMHSFRHCFNTHPISFYLDMPHTFQWIVTPKRQCPATAGPVGISVMAVDPLTAYHWAITAQRSKPVPVAQLSFRKGDLRLVISTPPELSV